MIIALYKSTLTTPYHTIPHGNHSIIPLRLWLRETWTNLDETPNISDKPQWNFTQKLGGSPGGSAKRHQFCLIFNTCKFQYRYTRICTILQQQSACQAQYYCSLLYDGHGLHRMRSRVYETVLRPSVCLSHPAATCCFCGFAAVSLAARKYRWFNARADTLCEQCHVVKVKFSHTRCRALL